MLFDKMNKSGKIADATVFTPQHDRDLENNRPDSIVEMSIDQLVAFAFKEAKLAAEKYHQENPHCYPCGFAWVNIKPARGKLVTYLKSIKVGRTDDYYGGYSIWNPAGANTQSMNTLEAGAKAFAKVLREAGYKANVCTRID